MARGLDNHNQRQDILKSFGRDLARRSGSSCELCEASGVSLEIYEVPPVMHEPDFDSCLFICRACKEGIDAVKKSNPEQWRFLTGRIWSDITAVKILSVMILRAISSRATWAAEVLDDLYLDEDEERRAAAGLI